MKVTHTYSTTVRVPVHAQPEVRRAINSAVIGRPNCNIVGPDGAIVEDPDVSDEQRAALHRLHWLVSASHEVRVMATFDTDTGEVEFAIG